VWDEVRHCSERCRRAAGSRLGALLEQAILDLLDARAEGATLCPSEAARHVRPDAWRPLLEEARRAGRRLAARGAIEVTQGGRAVDPGTCRGPVRFRSVR
jgi:hypothetical protein